MGGKGPEQRGRCPQDGICVDRISEFLQKHIRPPDSVYRNSALVFLVRYRATLTRVQAASPASFSLPLRTPAVHSTISDPS